jgi:hypothetical protein
MYGPYSGLVEWLERLFTSGPLRELVESVAKNATPRQLAISAAEFLLRWCPCCQDCTMNRNKKVDSEERLCYWCCRVCGYRDKRPCCVLSEPDTVEHAS